MLNLSRKNLSGDVSAAANVFVVIVVSVKHNETISVNETPRIPKPVILVIMRLSLTVIAQSCFRAALDIAQAARATFHFSIYVYLLDLCARNTLDVSRSSLGYIL